MKTKIAFVCNWGMNSAQLLEQYKKQTPNNSGVWNNLVGIDNIDNADIIIALGPIQSNLIDPSKIIQFRREPDFIESWNPLNGAKEIFDYSDGKPHVSTWWVELPWNYINDLAYTKTKRASIVASSKWQHRTKYIQELCKLMPNSFDVYGNINVQNQNHLGYIHRTLKHHSILEYEYSIAIENSSQSNYFSEKIIDCMLLWTIPLYWGCPNISDYFPAGSYREIDIQDPKQIKEVLDKPITKKNIDALAEARNLIMNEYNIWSVIEKII